MEFETADVDTGAETAEDSSLDTSTDADIESNSDEAEGVEQDSDNQDSEEEQHREEDSTDDSESELEYDGKKIPQQYKDLFKKDRKLREMYFTNAQYKQAFGSPSEAHELLETLETIGGLEAIQAEKQEWAQIDEKFTVGDPSLVEQWAKDFPEGFQKIAPAVMESFRTLDPDSYSHEIAKVMAATFQDSNLTSAVQQLQSLVKGDPQAENIIGNILNFLGGIDQLAKNTPKKSIDPERQKLQQERQEWENQKQEIFRQGIANDVTQSIKSGIKSNLTPYLKGKSLGKEEYSVLEENVNIELGKLLTADKIFQSQKANVLATGDKKRIAKFFQARLDKYTPLAAKKVMRTFNMFSGQKDKAAQQQQNLANKNVSGSVPSQGKLSKAPSDREIDFTKTSTDDIWNNKAVLKNGKRVTW